MSEVTFEQARCAIRIHSRYLIVRATRERDEREISLVPRSRQQRCDRLTVSPGGIRPRCPRQSRKAEICFHDETRRQLCLRW